MLKCNNYYNRIIGHVKSYVQQCYLQHYLSSKGKKSKLGYLRIEINTFREKMEKLNFNIQRSVLVNIKIKIARNVEDQLCRSRVFLKRVPYFM